MSTTTRWNFTDRGGHLLYEHTDDCGSVTSINPYGDSVTIGIFEEPTDEACTSAIPARDLLAVALAVNGITRASVLDAVRDGSEHASNIAVVDTTTAVCRLLGLTEPRP